MSMIAESELIINSDGSVYHLNLLPEEIAETVILVGDPTRVAAVSQYFDKIEVKKQRREFVTHTGYLNNTRLTVLSTGIGTDNVDIVINELDALANIDFQTRQIKEHFTSLRLVRLGTSGALQEDIPLDSYVISSHGLGFDCLLPFYDVSFTQEENIILNAAGSHFLPITPFYVTGGYLPLIEKFLPHCIQGITATCPGFYGPQGRILRGKIKETDFIERMTTFRSDAHRITNFEMETSGLYGLGRLLGHHCCSISTILVNRVTLRFSTAPYYAVDKMIQMALPILTTW